MQSFLNHPIFRKWPAQFPDRLQLFSLPTPNGIKISTMLEEIEMPYEVHRVDIRSDEQFSPEFLALNPNNKIPAIWDPQGPWGKPLALFESGAILLYLAEKTGKLLPTDPARRYETMQWVIWQVGGLGPMFGQVGFFYAYAGKDFEDKRPLHRYVTEARRLLNVLDQRLQNRAWVMGDDYTIADLAILPWVRALYVSYKAEELLSLSEFRHVNRVLQSWLHRPAVQRGVEIPQASA